MDARQFYEAMKKSECRKLNCHWFDGEACHRINPKSYGGINPEDITMGCVPETMDEYIEHCRKVAGMIKVSCKDCKHRVFCNKVDYPGLKNSFHYCDIFTYSKKGTPLRLYQSRQKCGFSSWEAKETK